jgi:hypothetical protein
VSDPIERTTRYATSVDELGDAWAFVMDHLEKVGPDPEVSIKPFWRMKIHDMDRPDYDDEAKPPRRFGVVVSGMVEVEEDA